MIFTLEPLRAKEGDCLLLHWSTPAGKKKIALIDGGPGRVYEDYLRPRLEEIAKNLKLDQLVLEIAMVSHLDGDHIVGVMKLFRQLRWEIDNIPQEDRRIRVKYLWHNIFNDIVGDKENAYYDKLPTATLAGTDGEPTAEAIEKLAEALQERQQESPEEARHNAYAIGLILATHDDGRFLRDDYNYLLDSGQIGILNSPFRDENDNPTLIATSTTPDPKIISGLKFTIVGPRRAQLLALQEEFDKYITKYGLTQEAVLAAYADKSIKNLSSIVCLVELGGKSILLTGDARGDYLLEGLSEAGLLDDEGKIFVDVLKVPHHGSDHNVESAFFEKVLADTYVFSGDGKHGNPERNTLEWLVKARGEAPITIVLTYTIKETDKVRKREHEQHGHTWVAKHHSLEAFFDELATTAPHVKFIAGAPVKIDLGDEKVTW